MDSKFWQDVTIALITFVLGLLTTPISRLFQRPKQRLAYYIEKQTVIAASELLPSLQNKLPTVSAPNIVQFTVVGVNTGSQTIKKATVSIVPNKGAELIQTDIETNPPRGVTYSAATNPVPNEVQCENITLERKQNIKITLLLKSEKKLESPDVYWAGVDGNAERRTEAEALGLYDHLVAALRNLIFAQVVPLIIFSLNDVLNFIFPSELTSPISALAHIIQLYYYIRIIPHIEPVVRELLSRWSKHV